MLRIGPRRSEPRVTDRDARLVEALAPHLAVVVATQRLTADLSRERERVTVATLTERDRLRRDLHDGLGPSLSGIALGLEAADKGARTATPSRGPRAARRGPGAEAESAVREIRRVLDGLRPCGARSSTASTGRCARRPAPIGMDEPGRPRLRLAIDPLPVLSPAVEESAYRIVAESLTNVARHSGAGLLPRSRSARSTAPWSSASQDDGDRPCGPTVARGHGLESMRRRATDLGGRLTVADAQPRGTQVTAVLPLEDP